MKLILNTVAGIFPRSSSIILLVTPQTPPTLCYSVLNTGNWWFFSSFVFVCLVESVCLPLFVMIRKYVRKKRNVDIISHFNNNIVCSRMCRYLNLHFVHYRYYFNDVYTINIICMYICLHNVNELFITNYLFIVDI